MAGQSLSVGKAQDSKDPIPFSTITIETSLTFLGRATLTFSYRLSRKENGDEVLIASGWTKHACLDEKGEVAKIAPDVEAILTLVNHGFFKLCNSQNCAATPFSTQTKKPGWGDPVRANARRIQDESRPNDRI